MIEAENSGHAQSLPPIVNARIGRVFHIGVFPTNVVNTRYCRSGHLIDMATLRLMTLGH